MNPISPAQPTTRPCIGCGQPTTLRLDTGEDAAGRVILEPACGRCQDGPSDDEPPTPKAPHTRHVEPKLAAPQHPYLAGGLAGWNGHPIPADASTAWITGYLDGHAARMEQLARREGLGGEAA